MAGMSHAGVVRTEHAAVAVGTAMIAALVPLWFLSGEAQAAGADSAPEATVAVVDGSAGLPNATSTPTGAPDPTAADAPSVPAGEEKPRPVPVVAAPRERMAPRSSVNLTEPSVSQAFAETPPVDEAAGPAPTQALPSSPPAAAPPVDPTLTPSGWFTPVSRYYFTARFGVPGSWSSGYHTGLDFATKQGTPIRAVSDGVVVAADWAGAYGQLLQLKVGPKTQVWMAHLDRFAVRSGEKVKAGEVIGYVGMTGNTSGPHVHFEVRVKGKSVNPERYFWPDGDSVTRLGRR